MSVSCGMRDKTESKRTGVERHPSLRDQTFESGRRRGVGFLVVFLAAFAPAAVHADDTSDLEGLLSEQVVSSASKQSEMASTAPALSTNLTSEDLRRYGIKTLSEAIDFLSLGVASSDNLNGGEIGARGVLITGDRGSHFLLLIDGHAVNEQVRGSVWFGVGAGIPIEIIDHVEIIVGPGSVLYGSNAMLGLINVVTKQAKDYKGFRILVESALPTTLRLGAGGGRQFSLFGHTGEITAHLEYLKQNGPSFYFAPENTGVDPFTGQPGRYSSTDSTTGTGIWGGQTAKNSLYAEAPSGIVRVLLGAYELELRGSYYRHGTPTGGGDFDDARTGEKERRASADLKRQHAISTLLTVAGRAYADYFSMDSNFITSRGALCPFGVVTCSYANGSRAMWGGLELQTTLDWFRDNRLVTVFGAELRARFIKTTSSATNVVTGNAVYPAPPGLDVHDTTRAAYAQLTWKIAESLHSNLGGRIDQDPRFSPVFTPRVALNWTGWHGGTLKAAYAEAFRAPSWDETSNATDRRIAAEKLAPEKVRSFEVSAQQKFGPHRILVGGFYSQWANLVELRTLSDAETIQAIRDGKTSVPLAPGVQLSQYQNAASIKNYGLNTGVDGSVGLDRFQYGLTLTAAVAQQVQDGTPQRLSVAPQLFGNARLSFVPGGNLPTLAAAAQFMGPRVGDHANEGAFSPKPVTPTQVAFRLCISGSIPGVSGLSYRALGTYSLSDRGPYVIGPVTSALPTQTSAQLNPIDRMRGTVALQYDF